MKTLPLIYVAGPYTRPDPVENTHEAVRIGMEMYDAGWAMPYIPHLTMFVHYLRPRSDVEYWYEFDLHALAKCDAVVRIPGDSSGADREVEYALELGLPVFLLDANGIAGAFTGEFVAWCNRRNHPDHARHEPAPRRDLGPFVTVRDEPRYDADFGAQRGGPDHARICNEWNGYSVDSAGHDTVCPGWPHPVG